MKFFSLILALFIALFSVSPSTAQNLPALEVMPTVAPAGTVLKLSLAPGATLPSRRVGVALYEWNRPTATPSAVVWKAFTLLEGRLQTTVTIEADPGFYEFRLLTADKAARPLTQSTASFQVPGVAREAGWWLPNGMPFFFLPSANEVSNSNTPLFVTGLQRETNRKAAANKNLFPSAPAWKTLPLPPLREMLTPNYDWAVLKSDLSKRLNEAQGRGERGFWGWSLPPGQGTTALSGASSAISQLRSVLKEISPGAALILEVETTSQVAQHIAQAARDVDGAAAFCDAVLLHVPDNDSAFWAVKTARRVAEEQFGYDLPILLRFHGAPSAQTLRSYLMTGATGFIFEDETNEITRQFRNEIARNASLWVGSVTLEDTGVLPPPDAPDALDDEALLNFIQQLRGIGRVPLLARATSSSMPESLMLRLGNRISGATIDRLERLARAGARIYIEGAPTFDETGKAAPWRMATLVGADVTAMAAKRTQMTLDDVWVFGTGRGTKINVEQNFALTLKPPTLSAQAKTEKGVLTQVGPRVVATLEDGSPGVIVNVIGRGEVIWLPHRLSLAETPKMILGNVPVVAAPINQPPQSSLLQKYLNGIADYVAPRLVQQRAKDDKAPSFQPTPVFLRRSAKGALLLWMDKAKQGTFPAIITVEGARSAALDLNSGDTLSPTTRGFQSTFELAKPGDALLALANTRQELETERNAPRAKAKLR